MTIQFYNDNSGRTYPLVDEGSLEMVYSGGGNVELPSTAIVDCSVIIGIDGEFLEEEHRVYLYEIERESAGTFQFRFRFTAPRLLAYELVFCRSRYDDEFSVSHVTATDVDILASSVSSLDLDCGFDLAEGWLTTGLLDDLAAILSAGEYLRRGDGDVWVEPAQVQSMYQAWARSISLANAPRILALPNASCGSAESDDGNYVVNATCLTGNIKWKEGFNCVIRQLTADNAIVIGAGVGGGAGELCDEVPLYDAETPPTGSTLLTGGPACHEVVKTINGVSGAHQQLIPGRGVSINQDDTEQHKIVVDLHLRGLAVCPDFLADSESSLTLD
jgi:hypothetical protein